MEPDHDERLRKQASKVYTAIGLPMPADREPEDSMAARHHGGAELVTTFHPTEEGPKLNVVHGPLATQDALLAAPVPVIGLSIVGAGLEARMRSDHPEPVEAMEIGDTTNKADREGSFEKPYFYPKRAKKRGSGIVKQKRKTTRHPKNMSGVIFR